MSRNTVAHINAAALQHNLQVLWALAEGAQVVAVVKADAYGHGIDQVVPALQAADVLAVATAGELQAVRQAGWSGRLLLLEGFFGPQELTAVRDSRAEYVVHQASQLQLLESQGGLAGHLPWLKINTGMNRLGLRPERVADAHAALQRLSGGLQPVLMTHFACADQIDNPMTARQVAAFDQAVAGLDAAHCMANSAALINYPHTARQLVRPGIALYGISPLEAQTGAAHGLQPVMTLSSELLAVNACKKGETVGYGATYQCPQDMTIGVVGIGYGDGYPRHAGNGTPVLVNGQRAAIAGRVSMDLLTIDLRGHEQVREGDPVTLWGDGLPVEEVARHTQSIPYELVSGLTGRVRRVVV